jgi:hypothetical protein
MSRKLLTITFRNLSNRAIAAYPVTYGVSLAQGVLRIAERLAIELPNGERRALQTKVLETHFDGSIKWLLLDFSLPLEANQIGKVSLVQSTEDSSASNAIRVEENDETIGVSTPRLVAAIHKKRFSLFHSYRVNGRELMPPGSDIVVENHSGKKFYASLAERLETRVLERGPLRTVIEVSGRHTAEDDATLLDFRLRVTFRADEPGVLLSYKFTNREEPETGVLLRSIHLEVPTAIGDKTTKLVRQCNSGLEWFSRRHEIRENVELTAGEVLSAEGKARYGVAAEGKVLIRNFDSLRENVAAYPYYLRPGNARTDMTGGLRQMYPYLGANGENGSALGWFFEMQNHYPKALRGERNSLFFDIWPHWAGELRVRRGQSKEHDLYLSLFDETREHSALEGEYFDHEIDGVGIWGTVAPPLQLTLDAEYVRATQILQLHRWLPYDTTQYFAIEAKLGSFDANGAQSAKGMMDFGDWINADRSWAHNNENDAILDMIREYYRREEATMLPLALAKARHNAHVDFIAFDPDKLRAGTMPAHCPEHTDGATYPSHMWVDGLLAAYDLTGNPDFLEVALSVGANMRRWQTGNPSVFYADARECGWPFLAYLRLHEFTHETKWLDACREIFDYYRARIGPDGEIKYALPHGVGTMLMAYGEFIAWRALFFYYERTGDREVKDFLIEMLDKVYLQRPGQMTMGWACNDLFPAWAAYTLTGDNKYIEDNYPFLQFLMQREGRFPWGGVDMHFYLGELHRRGVLARFAHPGFETL